MRTKRLREVQKLPQLLRRLLHIVHVLSWHGFLWGISAILRRSRWASAHLSFCQMRGPRRLCRIFEELDGTFIKFGQMLALQPDVIPLEYCDALFKLLDRVRPFPFQEVERIFREEFDRHPDDIFDSFDRQPMATASIGQVHVAHLNHKRYAVKVQRPAVESEFAGDIRLMETTIAAIRRLRIKPLYWMLEPLGEFVAWTREELDYRFEARYLQQLRENARDNPHETIPFLLEEYTTVRTLVVEFLEGVTVLNYLRSLEKQDDALGHRLDELGFDSSEVASNIIDNFLGDVFRHGMFHADLHPANLLILRDNVVGYIDFGITGTISRCSRENLVALTLAYTRGDLEGMSEAFFRVSAVNAESNVARFRKELHRAAESWYQSERKERRLKKNFTLVMLDMLRLSRNTGVWPERDVIKYIRSAIAIDGLITRFAPTFDLGQHLAMVCDHYLKWQVHKLAFDFHQMTGWAMSNLRLLKDGLPRATELLRNFAGANAADSIQKREPAGGSWNRLLFLSAFTFGAAVLAVSAPEGSQLGVLLKMSGAILAGSTLVLFARSLVRLWKEA